LIRDPGKKSDNSKSKQKQNSEQQNADDRDWLLLCKSVGRYQKESNIHSKAEQRFLSELDKLIKRVESGRLSNQDEIQRAIGRLLGKHQRGHDLAPGEITIDRFNNISQKEKVAKKNYYYYFMLIGYSIRCEGCD